MVYGGIKSPPVPSLEHQALDGSCSLQSGVPTLTSGEDVLLELENLPGNCTPEFKGDVVGAGPERCKSAPAPTRTALGSRPRSYFQEKLGCAEADLCQHCLCRNATMQPQIHPRPQSCEPRSWPRAEAERWVCPPRLPTKHIDGFPEGNVQANRFVIYFAGLLEYY